MRFTTKVLLEGKTATGIRVPPEVVAAMGKGKRPPVTVTINGTYRGRQDCRDAPATDREVGRDASSGPSALTVTRTGEP